jgi:riboflavin synthase
MFTGIIQDAGRIKSANAGQNLILSVESSKLASSLKKGDSVAVNGACLTVIETMKDAFRVEAIVETVSRTTIGELKTNDFVNLELPLKTGEMFHGHFVQGHVDCIGSIKAVTKAEGSWLYSIEFPVGYGKYLIEKGSIAVDGVSLTVVECAATVFSVAIIPHTFKNTVFRYRSTGDGVNLEFDMMAKYIDRMITADKDKITVNFLKEHGFG